MQGPAVDLALLPAVLRAATLPGRAATQRAFRLRSLCRAGHQGSHAVRANLIVAALAGALGGWFGAALGMGLAGVAGMAVLYSLGIGALWRLFRRT